MESRGVLDVWLGDELVGTLEDRTLGYMAFDFEEEAVLTHGVGSLLLSLSMPFSFETVGPFVATPFFAGLLPEGRARQRLAHDFRASPEDNWELLRLLGRESAGALVILPPGERPVSPGHVAPRPLTHRELSAEIERLPVAPLGVTAANDGVRLSLAGVQDKLPLIKLRDGALALPVRGSPSTVIAKPERRDERLPGLVANEAFCLAVAARIGVPVAAFGVVQAGEVPVLLVDRYDRRWDGEPIVRIHQEDACQATATFPANKYEAGGGPSLARVAELIGEHSTQPALDRMALLRLTIANVVLGNADAHGKNVSFLHHENGVQLAPAYDLVSTGAYPHLSDELAMRVGAAMRLSEVDRPALLDAAAAMGVGPALASRIVNQVRDELPVALEAAAARADAEGWAAPVIEQIRDATFERAARVLEINGP